MARELDIPAGRSARLLQLGKLAGGLAAGAVAEGLRLLGSGSLPHGPGVLLNPANARRLANRLSQMRGAAMKVGQLLSMEAGDFLPREFTDVLAHLRDDAHAMPMLQVAAQLEGAWGSEWLSHFDRFHFQPIAAASIGQVHKATTRDGRCVAIKVQYPGVAESIDSDVENIAALLSLFRLVSEADALTALLQEAKRQLHDETDYLVEALHMKAYRARVNDLPALHVRVPQVDAQLTRRNVLVMEFMSGEPVDALARGPVGLRDAVATRLVELFLKEVFDWGLVQTDPNFSNFLYLSGSGDLGLLDFGATRTYAPTKVGLFRRLLAAALRGDRKALMDDAEAVGYVAPGDSDQYRSTVLALLEAAAEPVRTLGPYDFSGTSLARRMSEQVLKLRAENRVWRTPPPDMLFLHRKLGGIYLLCARLGASVDVRRLVDPYVE